eukprot:61509-Amphidinium_carterae.1
MVSNDRFSLCACVCVPCKLITPTACRQEGVWRCRGLEPFVVVGSLAACRNSAARHIDNAMDIRSTTH